jgi:hypothetical protein
MMTMKMVLSMVSLVAVTQAETLDDGEYRFKVTVDPKSGNIEASALKYRGTPPKELSIRLFRDGATGQQIILKAATPKDPLPRYQGYLGPNAGSYAGLELSFETSLKAVRILKMVPSASSQKRSDGIGER